MRYQGTVSMIEEVPSLEAVETVATVRARVKGLDDEGGSSNGNDGAAHKHISTQAEGPLKEGTFDSKVTNIPLRDPLYRPPPKIIHDIPKRRVKMGEKLPAFLTNTQLDPSFEKDIQDVHLIYDYSAQDPQGNPEKWRYEMWFFSSTRIVYAIHGGPMAGRYNYQTATYQCIRPGELWQVNWLEETGTICSLVYDITRGRVTTMLGFSRGHWENPGDAHGDKRNGGDFERWRGLARVGSQVERFVLSEQASIVEKFRGEGDLKAIEEDAETF